MKKYFKASMLLMGLLFIQSTTASAQCPIKEQIMNGDDGGEGLEKAKREREKTPVSHTLIIFFDKKTGNKQLRSHQEAGLYPTLQIQGVQRSSH